jgi:nitrogen fixation NifU-like protein
MKLQFEVDDNGVIMDAKFKTFGCGSAIASSSVATEWLKGKVNYIIIIYIYYICINI